MTEPNLHKSITELAAANGLQLDTSSIAVNEMGLDFRVALAHTVEGERWVLRIPRRKEVTARADVEARLLQLVAAHLTPAVPEWRIHSPELIAYPALPGEPGLEFNQQGEHHWRVDVSSAEFSLSLGDLLAELHAVDTDTAGVTGIQVQTPAEVRQAWSADIETVAAEFQIAQDLRARWDAWLEEDSYWPQFSVLTHGEIYPAHTLVTNNAITGVLDWTTAAVDDPAKDFMFHQFAASAEAFELTVNRYVERGGQVWPRLAEHCAELFSASPVGYGLYALTTGEDEHRQAAAAQLNPPAAS